MNIEDVRFWALETAARINRPLVEAGALAGIDAARRVVMDARKIVAFVAEAPAGATLVDMAMGLRPAGVDDLLTMAGGFRAEILKTEVRRLLAAAVGAPQSIPS